MKKYFLAALVILSASTFAANVTVFGGLNLNGKLLVEDDGIETRESADEAGYTYGIEINKKIKNLENGKIEVGLGTKYETSFMIDEFQDKTLATTMPIYLSGKLSQKVSKSTNVFIKGSVGYTLPFEGDIMDSLNNSLKSQNQELELGGGLYTGIGIGVEMNKLVLGLDYSISRVSVETKYINSYTLGFEDYEYSKLALTVGAKFGN